MIPLSVSVLLPVFNCAKYLDAAILSIRKQTMADWELVAVNDGSTDNSLAILCHHAAEDKRVVVISQQNTGIATALNAGLEVCRGKYIARMDGDDVAEPARLEEQVAFLERNPHIGAVGGWATISDELDNEVGRIENPIAPSDVDAALDRGNYSLLHPTLVVRRDCLAVAGNYDTAFCHAEDLDLLLRLREITKLANLPRTVLRYRKRVASMSDVGKSKYPIWDQKALLATHARGRRPVPTVTLARAAERVSWTALDAGDYPTAAAQAWQAVRHAPLSAVGPRALARVGWRWARYGQRGVAASNSCQ